MLGQSAAWLQRFESTVQIALPGMAMNTNKLATVLLGLLVSNAACKKDEEKDEAKTTSAP